MCFDSNRPGFDNHNVKDSSGNITCTYLLNIKCHTCGNFGHTPKYCKSKKYNTPIKSNTSYKSPSTSIPQSPSNIFAILCDDQIYSDDKNDYFELPPVSEIVWGVGFLSTLNNKSWANVCCDVSA